MIISDKHNYLFIQTPMTGSSAVARELLEHYDGREILSKHALYSTFVANSSKEQRNYFVFSAVRHPMDKYVSNYVKMLNNHNNRYTGELSKDFRKRLFQIRDRRIYKKVVQGQSFGEFLSDSKIYDEASTLYFDKLNYVMNFETLHEDFDNVLNILKIDKIRELPEFNVTMNKSNYLDYYSTDEIQNEAVKKFGVFISKSVYSFPKEWNARKPTRLEKIQYSYWHLLRIMSWKYFRRGIRGHKL